MHHTHRIQGLYHPGFAIAVNLVDDLIAGIHVKRGTMHRNDCCRIPVQLRTAAGDDDLGSIVVDGVGVGGGVVAATTVKQEIRCNVFEASVNRILRPTREVPTPRHLPFPRVPVETGSFVPRNRHEDVGLKFPLPCFLLQHSRNIVAAIGFSTSWCNVARVFGANDPFL